MPELPEVETIARGLANRVTGDTIESVWVATVSNLLKSPAEAIATTLDGAKIIGVRRQGKHIVIDLTRDGSAAAQWIVHLGMTGRLLVTDPHCEILKHTHLIATLASGREMRFVDPRRFGKIWVHVDEAGFDAGGVEPLEVDAGTFAGLFHGRKTSIKAALLNQKLLRGVGNIYADEALFRAGIRPRKRAAALTRAQLMKLHGAVQEVLREAIAAGGSSVNDYVDENGDAGFFQLQHRVYGREGEPCLVCATPIKKIVAAGRGTHYCPHCQS